MRTEPFPVPSSPRSAPAAIEVRHVSKSYATVGGSFEAVRDVDLRVDRGRFVSVIGLSGCGKSTLLRIIGGLIDPTEGTVDIDGLPPKAAQQQKSIGFVFQDAALLPWLSVVDNV